MAHSCVSAEQWFPKRTKSIGKTMTTQIMRRYAVGLLALLFASFTTTIPAKADCESMPGPGIDWTGCDKFKTTLAGIDFTGATLNEALLARSDLRNANFSDAKLNE